MSGPRAWWREVDPDLFRFTTTDLRMLHVALMAAFADAAVLAPALNLDQVHVALGQVGWTEALPDDVVASALASLAGWGLLEATQDHTAHYATPEEFERKNLQWSLTRRGEASVRGLLHALDALRAGAGLQVAVLVAIGDGLAELAGLLTTPSTSEVDARIHIRLAEVEGHLASLVANVRQFNGHLQRLVREDATTDEVFVEVKRRTVAYLEEYVEGVERPQRRVAAGIEQVVAAGTGQLFARALRGANLAPSADDDPRQAWLAERERRWAALRAWFAPEDSGEPRIAGLLGVARMAIVQLLRVLERRWDNRRRSASIAMDFRRLAGWFAAAPGTTEAHQLFAAAFGMWPARHAHLPPPDGEARGRTTSWASADPVDVAPALRTSGSLATRGPARPVPDPGALRARRHQEQLATLAAAEELRAHLLTTAPVRLSSFTGLSPAAFHELLALLGAGLTAPLGTDGSRRALSDDGRTEIVLTDPGDGRQARVESSDGVLSGPDLLVCFTADRSARADGAPASPPRVLESTHG